MTAVSDFVGYSEEQEQRKKFRRFMEDVGNGFKAEAFNISYGTFKDPTLEMYFLGWCMKISCAEVENEQPGHRLGYVKTKLDENNQPYVTSFSAVPMEDHKPVRLDN